MPAAHGSAQRRSSKCTADRRGARLSSKRMSAIAYTATKAAPLSPIAATSGHTTSFAAAHVIAPSAAAARRDEHRLHDPPRASRSPSQRTVWAASSPMFSQTNVNTQSSSPAANNATATSARAQTRRLCAIAHSGCRS